MVSRYDKFRRPVYRNAPWWQRNMKSLFVCSVVGCLAFVYIPMINAFRMGKKTKQLEILNPRSGADLMNIRKRFKDREKDQISSPTPRI